MTLNDAFDSLVEKIDNNFIQAKHKNNIPLGYGMWSEQEMPGSGWVAADGVTELSADDYPEYWSMLLAIRNGTQTSNYIKVCDVSSVNSLISGVKDWEKITGQQKIAYYHIIDTTNETFILPRCIDKSLLVGKRDAVVITGTTENNGYYTINSEGLYCEFSPFAQLNKATRTVVEEETVVDDNTGEETTQNVNKTYTYYTMSQVGDAENPFELETYNANDVIRCKKTSATLVFEFAQTLINTKYTVSLYTSKPFIDTGNNGETILDIGVPYPATNQLEGEDTKTTSTYSVRPYVYDEQLVRKESDFTESCGGLAAVPANEGLKWANKFLKVLGDNDNNMILLCMVVGYVVPPTVANYTTNERLYIRLKK